MGGMNPIKKRYVLVSVIVATVTASAFAQTASNSLAISWTGGGAKNGSVNNKEGQPTGRIINTDSNSSSPVLYSTYVNLWTSDGGVRGPVDSDRSSFGGLVSAAAGVSTGLKALRVGKYTAVGYLSLKAKADPALPTIFVGNVAFLDNPCLDSMAGSFSITSIEVEKLPNRYHVTKLSATLDGTCKASGGNVTFHATMNANEPALGGVLVDPPADDGSGDGSGDGSTGGNGDGGNGGTPTPTPTPTPIGPTVVLSDDVRATPLMMGNSSTSTVLFSTFAPSTSTSDVSVFAQSDADDLLVSVDHPVVAAPGSGDEILTIQTTPTTIAGNHFVTITASDGVTSSSATVFVTVFCDPPFILGIDQPKSSTIGVGRPAQLSVKASGSGPFTYQWFTGASGLANFPLPGGTSANFTTSALNDTTSYWVRVTNPCGSVNSQTATVNVSAPAKPTGRR